MLPVRRIDLHVLIVMKSVDLNLLEPSGPVQACTRIALPLLVANARQILNEKCRTVVGFLMINAL